MKTNKKILGEGVLTLVVSAMLLILGVMMVSATTHKSLPVADNIIFATTDSGSCGENVTWTFDSDTATLTISGTGAMDDYTYSESKPYSAYREAIQHVVIESGVTEIGECAFYQSGNMFTAITDVSFANTITKIGRSAFSGCTSLASVDIQEGVEVVNVACFEGCTALNSVVIPGSVTFIESSAFSICTSLKSIVFKEGSRKLTLAATAFSNCSALEVVDMSGRFIDLGAGGGYNIFEKCLGVKAVYLPDKMKADLLSNQISFARNENGAYTIRSRMTVYYALYNDGTFKDSTDPENEKTGTWAKDSNTKNITLTYSDLSEKVLVYHYWGHDIYAYDGIYYDGGYEFFDLIYEKNTNIKGTTFGDFIDLYDEVQDGDNTYYVLKSSAKNADGKVLVYADNGELDAQSAKKLFPDNQTAKNSNAVLKIVLPTIIIAVVVVGGASCVLILIRKKAKRIIK